MRLDGPDLKSIMKDEGYDEAKSVVLHELGHLVGLDHVDDQDELMNPVSDGSINRVQSR